MTETATTEAPAYTHTETCDLLTLGRNVRAWVTRYGTDGPNPLRFILEDDTDAFRHTCDCKALALSRVNSRLRLARKSGKAAERSGNAVGLRRALDAVVDLLLERDRIRDTP